MMTSCSCAGPEELVLDNGDSTGLLEDITYLHLSVGGDFASVTYCTLSRVRFRIPWSNSRENHGYQSIWAH
jgi:hypothetical protein